MRAAAWAAAPTYLTFTLTSERIVRLAVEEDYNLGGGFDDLGGGFDDFGFGDDIVGGGDSTSDGSSDGHGDGSDSADGSDDTMPLPPTSVSGPSVDGGVGFPDSDAGPSEGGRVNTLLALVSGGCTSSTQVACIDDSCGRQGFEQFFGKLPAGTYTVMVSAQNGSSARARVSLITLDPTGLEIIDSPGIYVGNTSDSGDDVDACGYIAGGNDVTYAVAACTNQPFFASTCGSTAANPAQPRMSHP